uniref:Centromere/kinetochore protein zw10 homolog n=1 Tax=Sphaeramia orbicularis TaxID=375764 RepID=A0A672ZE46_9TELE
MASFVTEVLASSGKLEKEDLSSKISKMSRKVEDTKDKVCDMMNKRYSDFLPSLQSSETLMGHVDEVSKEMEGLKNCIENEVFSCFNIVVAVPVSQFHNAMEEFNKALLEKKYVDAANLLEKARLSVDSLKSSQLPLLSALSSELTVQRENLVYHLGDEWRRLIVDQCCVVVSGQVLLKNMLKPLVMYPSLSTTVIEQQEEGIVLALQCLEETHKERSTPAQVYSKLLLVLYTLHSHLLDICIGDKKLSMILGELIWEDISQCIIHECLLYSIPTNSSQLEKYSTVIKETEEFEKSLKEMEYLQGDSTDLLKYARDVNCHFASKKCRDVIVAARTLMTSKMHNTVKITPDSRLCLPKLPASGLDKKKENCKEEVTMENSKQLSAWSLCLPACRISESVQQLMELALSTLCEAVGSSTQWENLLRFPHLAAIQHNNCMYLAHYLLTLGHHFRAHLPEPLCEGVATFVDMVPGFRKLGAQCFLAQLNVQRAELLERLSTAHKFCNLDDGENYIAASKAVRQVIHQLKQLGTVWQEVLPVTIYCKAMGNLLNTAIAEIISKIMMLEDISSEDGEHLHTLCQTITEEGPLVFTPLAEENKNEKYQEEVSLYVKKWSMFKELVIVLRANLQEIVDRWADAKGPLAMEFTSSEVKSLIRALFQNTERRAVALTKIK